jgi:hypothetical protein
LVENCVDNRKDGDNDDDDDEAGENILSIAGLLFNSNKSGGIFDNSGCGNLPIPCPAIVVVADDVVVGGWVVVDDDTADGWITSGKGG